MIQNKFFDMDYFNKEQNLKNDSFNLNESIKIIKTLNFNDSSKIFYYILFKFKFFYFLETIQKIKLLNNFIIEPT